MVFRKIEPNRQAQEEPSPPGRFRKIEPSPELSQKKGESAFNATTKGAIEGTIGNIKGAEFLSDPFKAAISYFSGKSSPQDKIKENLFNQAEEFAEENLPSQEGPIEDTFKRAGRIGSGAFMGPGGFLQKAASTAGGALLGQLAEESGWGPFGQAIAEVVGGGLGGFKGKRLHPKTGSRQEQLVDIAKRHGLSEKEIAPAIQSERKIGLFGPLAHKGKATVGKIAASRTALGRIYENLRKSPAGQKHLNQNEIRSLGTEFGQEMQKVPSSARKVIEQDVADMIQSPPNPDSIMNLYQDINYNIGKGVGHLGGLRKILENHLTQHLGEDFKAANELFANVRKLGIKVRPDLSSHFHDYRSASDLAEAIVKRDRDGIFSAMMQLASRFTASKTLVSPYLQHIPRKLLDSATQGNIENAKKVLTLILNQKEEKD